MTRDEALTALRAYRAARDAMPDAVLAAASAGVPQTVIARESGLSREGVRKIISRLGSDGLPERGVVEAR